MAEEIRVTKRSRISSALITIEVGTNGEQNTLGVHEGIINRSSPFFRAALNRQWKEGKARKIYLPEDSPEAVACYIDWCYTKEIASKPDLALDEVRQDDLWEESNFLFDLYAFGDKAQDDPFCDAVMTALTSLTDQKGANEEGDMWKYFPGPDCIAVAYNRTPAGSPIRQFVVDVYISWGE